MFQEKRFCECLKIIFLELGVAEFDAAPVEIIGVADEVVVEAAKGLAVRDDEDCRVVLVPSFEVVEEGFRARKDAARSFDVANMGFVTQVVNVVADSFGPAAMDFLPFKATKRALPEAIVVDNLIFAVGGNLGGLSGALEWRGVDGRNVDIFDLVAQGFGLLDAGSVKRDIHAALRFALGVPIGFTVASEIEFHEVFLCRRY